MTEWIKELITLFYHIKEILFQITATEFYIFPPLSRETLNSIPNKFLENIDNLIKYIIR